ncbi:unnamed protein product [Rotaria sordida]|uniref:G domain-containing protein n=1 Tax=Rotaria sordida TaxID=392033 RepID=A0A813XXL6_9BILA|nr:unnamed protein product [Rotaria sordida]
MSSSDRLTKNTSNGMFAHNNIASTFTCDCGQEYDNQIALDEHKRMNCQNRGFFCQLCDEKLPTSEAMGAHLIQCGNKTIKCFSCQKYIRRGVYAYHVDNNCIDLDENYTNSSRSNRDNLSFHRQDTSSNSMGKTSQIQEDLCKDYYSIEVNHITEKLQFNIILMGSPRVGKSQLINAICNGENKAETSSSLNSCTKEVSCYFLEDNQQQMSGIKPFRVNFYDTPGIESWANQGGVTTMLKFIEDKDPICVMYCAAPGTFADLSQVRPVLKFCQEKRIFWAFVCTNMWSNVSRKEVIREFEKELAIFGDGTEKFFDQLHSRIPHKVTIFGNNALCTMVNSIEFYDPDYSPEKKPVQGIDELIQCIMEALDNDKLLGWCSAVLYRRSYWEKFSQKLSGFVSLRMKNIQNITSGSIQSIAANTMMSIFSMIRKRSV